MLKINTKNRLLTRILAILSLLMLITLSSAGPLTAQSLNQGYKSDETLQKGMLVKENKDDNSKVEPATQAAIQDLKGVVVSKNDSPVVIASEDQTIFVANTGTYEVLVSDENGSIKAGDYLSVSSVDGIAMKANNKQSIVLGRAAADFKSSDAIGSTEIKSSGKAVSLGRIQADISIASNPLEKRSPQDTVPAILKEVSSSVAGRPVSNARIWLASIVFLVTSTVTGIMLYGGAKSSLLALGRNPLSKASIIRGLVQVVVLGLIVFICGIFGVYLLLKL